MPQTAVEQQGGRSLKLLICSESNGDAPLQCWDLYTLSQLCVCVSMCELRRHVEGSPFKLPE